MSARRRGAFRGGRVHVAREMCETCIFRPGNLMNLRPGRLREMVDAARENDSAIVCHERLEIAGCEEGDCVCRGFFDRYRTLPLEMAERLDVIEYVPSAVEFCDESNVPVEECVGCQAERARP